MKKKYSRPHEIIRLLKVKNKKISQKSLILKMIEKISVVVTLDLQLMSTKVVATGQRIFPRRKQRLLLV